MSGPPSHLDAYRGVQAKAKAVLREIRPFLKVGTTEKQIAGFCVELLREKGLTKTWYYDVPALVLVGSRSCLSLSGRDYVASEEAISASSLVTIDLSPLDGTILGDCARSYVIEGGEVTDQPTTPEFRQGREALEHLHRFFVDTVRPHLTFEQVWAACADEVGRLGYVNLDFLGNVGHSLVTRREDRVFFERGNSLPVGEVPLFTFEPHIRQKAGQWGFKHENVYFFGADGVPVEL